MNSGNLLTHVYVNTGVAATSTVAVLQSVGAAGLSLAAKAGLATVGAVVGGGVGGVIGAIGAIMP